MASLYNFLRKEIIRFPGADRSHIGSIEDLHESKAISSDQRKELLVLLLETEYQHSGFDKKKFSRSTCPPRIIQIEDLVLGCFADFNFPKELRNLFYLIFR